MRVIQANCRLQFTAEDVQFILEVLRPRVQNVASLVRLLAEEETRDLILDDEDLFRAVLGYPGCLRVSTHLYFYLLVRQVFRRAGLVERTVADYVAAVLADFSRTEHTECRLRGQGRRLEGFVDLLATLETVDDTTAFYIRAHLGNHSLFLAGIFPERIRTRAERRGAPGLSYYEQLGRSSYRVAGDHRLARKYDLASIFNTLAERFQTTRLALNDLGERLLTLGDSEGPSDRFLRSCFRTSA